MEQYYNAAKRTDRKRKAFDECIYSIRNKSQKLTERHSKLLERQRDLTEQNDGSNIKGSDKIHLNVGGTAMYALRETLTLVKGSRLEALFSGRWENKLLRDEDGRIFFDLDPYYFKKIMEYLYSIKTIQGNHKTNAQENQGTWPRFTDANKQKVFDLYVNFFRLRTVGKGYSDASTTISSNTEDSSFNTVDSYIGLVDTFKKEEEELYSIEKNLDRMENKLTEEEDFVSFFTATTEDVEDAEDARSRSKSDDAIPFTSMSSGIDSKLVPTSKQADKNANMDSLILNLWIDGEIVSVKRSTMCVCKDSRLADDFSGDGWIKKHSFKSEDGKKVLLIEHSSVFKSIINQLRLQAMMIPEDKLPMVPTIKTDNMALLEKVVSKLFAGKEEFVLGCKSQLDSLIVESQSDDDNQIMSWLGEVNRNAEPKLLYRASRDGWESSSFHSLCDNKGETLAIVKTSEGYVFGGYSDQSWDSSSIWKSSSHSFLFSLKCNAGLPPTRMKLKAGSMHKNVIYCDPSYGPSFGNDDLQIGSSSDLRTGRNNFHHTYEIPSGASINFLTGKTGGSFQIAEVEVFKV